MNRFFGLAYLTLLLAACEGGATRGIGPILGPAAGPAAVPALVGIEQAARDGTVAVGGPSAAIGRRVAVVIGNSRYTSVSALENPRRDAAAMAGLLRDQGFHVIEGLDLSKRAFEGLLREAVLAGGPGSEILVFYAGHGFQIANRNYLVPVDAQITGPNDLPLQTVRLSSVFRILGDRAGSHVSFLDACRNNPFPAEEVKAGVTSATDPTALGFSEPRVPRGGLVAYSTQPGTVAFDGDGANSPFTEAMLRHAGASPQADITTVLRRVRSDVRAATGGQQIPTWVSALPTAFALKPAGIESVAAIPAAPPGAPAVAGPATPTATTPATTTPATTTPAASPETPPTPVLVAAAPATAPAPSGRPAVTVDAPMEQIVAVGSRVSDALGLPPEATVVITGGSSMEGEIATIDGEGELRVESTLAVPGNRIGAVVYTLPPKPRPVSARPAESVMMESFTAEVTLPGGAPQTIDVSLRLVPDACDVAAGDFLDLQGIGLYSEGGVNSGSGAVEACLAATRREPRNARFQFLLGRAYQAANNYVLALEAFRRAAAMGHLRAWVALGKLAEARNDPPEVALGYYQKGANDGDPLAIEALGILKLRVAATRAEREEAYELLGFAIDLGLPDAMKALAEYYSDPQSPDVDMDRAASFAEAAASRSGSVTGPPRGSPGLGAPVGEPAPGGGPGDRGGGEGAGDDKGGSEGF